MIGTSIVSRLSLRTRFFLLSSLLLFVSLVVVYAFVRPQYDQALLAERTTIVSEQQRYAIQAADRELSTWFSIAKYLATMFSTRPEQFETALRDQIGTHPNLIRISVLSLQTGDELEAQNSNFPNRDYPIAESDWQASLIDSSISVAFCRADSAETVCAVRLNTSLLEKPYLLTCLFDASQLFRTLLSLPLSEETELALFLNRAPMPTLLASTSNFKLVSELSLSSLSESRLITHEGKAYLLMASPFQTVAMHFVTLIPREVILEPANRLMIFSLSFIGTVLVIMFVVGWVASAQVTKPVQELVDSVKPMQSLDFSQPVPPSSLPELRTLSLTIDSMRQTLDRYQKLNVEKIIFEEWKNKLLMTYSEDLIGIAGGDDRFTFQNKRFAELCHELGFQTAPTRDEFFRHRSVKIVKRSKSTESLATFEAERYQSELEITFGETVQAYRTQTVALYTAEKNFGRFIYHSARPYAGARIGENQSRNDEHHRS
jgi:hypothetical protein